MEEKVFLTDAGLLVSSSRVEINGATFATRNIGSVRVESPGISKLALLIASIGVISCTSGSYIFGLSALAIGVIWGYTTATQRKLKLVTGGGEVVALESSNGKLVERLRVAIADAISVR